MTRTIKAMTNRETHPSNVVGLPTLRLVCGGISAPYNVGRASPAAAKTTSIELARMRSLTESFKPPAT
ncbi:hypothetical protein QTI66_32760 [Variovorax sp. J22R133]|uniref:hypothetical protein n=1 Tax=Variovorax brevis TaxID=3053503 RepID=UPI002578BCDB|nr:hypothetical protein [Variovorax sp. J22R133]MDM0116900.1 hypothetical protein [Variovorax sp. J22R133]